MKKKVILFLIVIFSLEISSLIFFKFYPIKEDDVYIKKFSNFEKKILNNNEELKKYYKSLNYSVNLGWDNSPLDSRLNSFKARVDHQNEKKKMSIITFGSSFCWGDGVKHHETWQHYLSNYLNVYVSNFGVGGYGPFQSYLKFKNYKNQSEDQEIAILSIFEIEIDRIRNNYLNFYFNSGYRIRPIPEVKSNNLHYKILPDFSNSKNFTEDLLTFIKENKSQDIWWERRIEIKFPYFINLIKLFVVVLNDRFELNFIYSKSKNSWNNKITNSLLNEIIDNFVMISEDRGLKPYILFAPRIRYKLNSGYKYVKFKNNLIKKNYNVIDFADFINTFEDRENKNLVLSDGHFSPRAYRLLAKFLSKKLKL